jgi:hypothetical protein
MGTGVLSKGKIVGDVILTRHFPLQPRLRMSGTISQLLTGINVVVVVVVVAGVVVFVVVIHVL